MTGMVSGLMREIIPISLTAEAFAPYGDVIEASARARVSASAAWWT